MRSKLLAAVRFDDRSDVDRILADFAALQMGQGTIVRGVLQNRGKQSGECHCRDMDLAVLGSNNSFRISQSLGSGSSGCRLHTGSLAQCAALLDQQLEHGCDLLVLNRFGRGESDGRGFRDLISKAIEMEVPTILAVRATYLHSWHAYVGDYAEFLPPDLHSLAMWFDTLRKQTADRMEVGEQELLELAV